MTSTLVLQLVEEGLVDLDTPVAEYLGPDWIEGYVLDGVDHAATVTVRQLLNHTDGFAEFAFDLGFYLLVSERLDVPLEPEEVIAWAGERGPQYVPGEAYAYNTVGHIVAGLLVEELTGRDAAEVMAERLFEPAGATSAYLPPTLLPADGQGAVDGYVQGALRDALGAIPGFAPFAEAAAVGEFYDLSVAPQEVLRTAGWTGGGLEATAIDTARIVRSMFDGTALEADTVEEFTTPWDGAATGYGLGISRGDWQGWTTYSHGGGVPGFRSDAVHVPLLGLTIAASANLIEVDPDIGELSEAVLDVVVDRLAVD
jgi:D-alanyl-D-alanine carboxypeptidase